MKFKTQKTLLRRIPNKLEWKIPTLGSITSLFLGLFCNCEVTLITTSLIFLKSPGLIPCWITPSTLTANWEPAWTLINSPNTLGWGDMANFTLVDCNIWKKYLGIGREALTKISMIFLRTSTCWKKNKKEIWLLQ